MHVPVDMAFAPAAHDSPQTPQTLGRSEPELCTPLSSARGKPSQKSLPWHLGYSGFEAEVLAILYKIDSHSQKMGEQLNTLLGSDVKSSDGRLMPRVSSLDDASQADRVGPRIRFSAQMPHLSVEDKAEDPVLDFVKPPCPVGRPRLNAHKSVQSFLQTQSSFCSSAGQECSAGRITTCSTVKARFIDQMQQRSILSEALSEWRIRSSGRNFFQQIAAFGVALHMIMDDIDRPDFVAACFRACMRFIIVLSIIVPFLESMESTPIDRSNLRKIDIVFGILFLLEFVVRVVVNPRFFHLFLSFSISEFFMLIDLAAAIPFWLLEIVDVGKVDDYQEDGSFGIVRWLILCLAPQLRLLKMLRYMEHFQLLSHASVLLSEALPSLIFVMIIIMWSFSSLLVLVEPADNLQSLSHAMWLTLVSMTTVGYGDVSPVTVEGHLVCSGLVLTSFLYMAMPLGIIGSIFTQVWTDRDRILLVQRTRDRLAMAGYSAYDIPELFDAFAEEDGELDIFAFREMMLTMQVGLQERRVNELFLQFDFDGSGTVSAAEFIRHLFPKIFYELHGWPEDDQVLEKETLAERGSGNKVAKTRADGYPRG